MWARFYAPENQNDGKIPTENETYHEKKYKNQFYTRSVESSVSFQRPFEF